MKQALRRDKNKPIPERKTVKQYVEEQNEKDKKQSKFVKKIYELMLTKPDDEHTYEWLGQCFKKAQTMTECEQCTEPGYYLFNNAMYCTEHGKTS